MERARSQASDNKLFGYDAGLGPYTEKFWARVAAAVRPPRTEAECADAYIALRRSPVARFSGSGRKISVRSSTASPR
jgi:hypothetical protein